MFDIKAELLGLQSQCAANTLVDWTQHDPTDEWQRLTEQLVTLREKLEQAEA